MPFLPGNKEAAKGDHRKARLVTRQLIVSLNKLDEDGRSRLSRLVEALIAKGVEGDVQAIREIIDRVEGKAPQFSTNDISDFRRATDLSDDELAHIAAGSGNGADPAPIGPQQPDSVH